MARAAAVLVLVLVIVALWQARLRSPEPSEEAHAVSVMAAIARAQAAYAATAGHSGYAANLDALGRPCPGTARGFLDPAVGSDPAFKSAYEVSLRVKPGARQVSSDCNAALTYSGYYITAVPRNANRKWRAFATDESGNIWCDTTGTAPKPPFRETATLKVLQ